MASNIQTGRIGEQFAVEHLRQKGYVIIGQNVNSRWGELDVVAEHDNKIIFVEVKTRKGLSRGKPYEGVTRSKLYHLRRTIQHYILVNNLDKRKHQLDVIGIVLNADNSVQELRHYENVGW